MLQLSLWKKAGFRAISVAERGLRGSQSLAADDLRKIRNFLVLQYESPLGSVVHATPLFEALKRAAPDGYIAVAASPMAAAVLRHNPYIDRCLVTASPFAEFRQAVRSLRGMFQAMPTGPRCIVTTIGNQRSRIALLSLLAGGAIRAGYTLAPELYHLPLSFQPERGQIEGNLDIVRRLGHTMEFREPHIFFGRQDAEHARQWLELLPGGSGACRAAFVTHNSSGQSNRWSVERFRQVIARLTQDRGVAPIFLGTAKDAAAIDALRQKLPDQGISLAGKTTISELAAVLAQCDLVVSQDTGTFHVARAVGLPGVVTAPAWQSPLEWLPVNQPRYRVLRGPTIEHPPADYSMEEISADQVYDAAVDLLEKFPADPGRRAERVQDCLR